MRMYIAHILDRLPWTCWAALAVWGLGYGWVPPLWKCRDTGIEDGLGCCWCGKRCRKRATLEKQA
ncbi:MAG: hypothetical protein ACREJC_20175 [Tepidisphaeraceae bacterium]